MTYQNISYVSIAVNPPSPEQIDALLLDARDFNFKNNVTGVLICHKNTFFQFFEGPPKSVELAYDRIKKSKLHTNILELSNNFSNKRYFNAWAMGFCYVPSSEMQALIHAEWLSLIPTVNQNANESFGLKMLLEFWHKLGEKSLA